MKKIIFTIAISLLSNYLPANDISTDQKGFFIGAGIGNTSLAIKPIDRAGFESFDIDATLSTLFLGHNFTESFGLDMDLSISEEFTDTNTNLDTYVFGTSVIPRFTHHINNNSSLYLKAGLQYIAYTQSASSTSRSNNTWSSTSPVIGAGFLYSFDFGLRARIDYKYSDLTLNRSNFFFSNSFTYSDIDLTYDAITISAHYQF